MPFKYGLKLFSTNENWFERASEAYAEKKFDFIELAVKSDLEWKIKPIAHIPLSYHIAVDDANHFIFMPNQLMENTADMSVEQLPDNLCLDVSKAITASIRDERYDFFYKDYINMAIITKKPFYFHLSSAQRETKKSEHLNLWEGNIDWGFIKKIIPENAYLVFETPKDETGVDNDLKNMEWFRQL